MIFFACLKMIDGEHCFKYLSSKYLNIKFIMEKETNNFLPFYMFLLRTKIGHFSTSMCRKKTPIGLLTQYNSFTPFSYKIDLIKSLIHKAFKITNS